jgi:cytochrome c peroxidase
LVDYSINLESKSLFSKNLYVGQEIKGVFRRVTDSASLEKIEKLGELFFFDPIFSLNNERACSSCHQPDQFFTRNDRKTEMDFQQKEELPRNTISLVNSYYNHLLMADGKHYSLIHQALGVIENPKEMNENREQVMRKILSCQEYKKELNQLVKLTPSYPEVSIEHVISCISHYIGKFSSASSTFDLAIQGKQKVSDLEKAGFNIFMGKGQCGTCHFIPHFNGVKPPYNSSEFEVLGTPDGKDYQKLSPDIGRFGVHPVKEMKNAFRTGTLKNIAKTAPYMHNGVFSTLKEVIDFYNDGGGIGHGLIVENQTLSSDSLHLSELEKQELIAFLEGLTEEIPFFSPPKVLPKSKFTSLNQRKPGGNYP